MKLGDRIFVRCHANRISPAKVWAMSELTTSELLRDGIGQSITKTAEVTIRTKAGFYNLNEFESWSENEDELRTSPFIRKTNDDGRKN